MKKWIKSSTFVKCLKRYIRMWIIRCFLYENEKKNPCHCLTSNVKTSSNHIIINVDKWNRCLNKCYALKSERDFTRFTISRVKTSKFLLNVFLHYNEYNFCVCKMCLKNRIWFNDSSGMKLTSLLPKCISFKCIYLYDILIESWYMLLFLNK